MILPQSFILLLLKWLLNHGIDDIKEIVLTVHFTYTGHSWCHWGQETTAHWKVLHLIFQSHYLEFPFLNSWFHFHPDILYPLYLFLTFGLQISIFLFQLLYQWSLFVNFVLPLPQLSLVIFLLSHIIVNLFLIVF